MKKTITKWTRKQREKAPRKPKAKRKLAQAALAALTEALPSFPTRTELRQELLDWDEFAPMRGEAFEMALAY